MLVITGTLFFFHHRGHGGHGVLLIKQKKLYVLCALCGEFPYLCSVMEKFELHILGCGSALPTTRHFATSQVVNVRDKLYMIDCGDHCFGLLGLISTLNLLGRTAELHIHSPKGLEALFVPMLSFFCRQMTYQVLFHEFETKEPGMIYEDRSLTVTTIPLRHRMPCCGFLFAEKQRPNHIIREMVDFYEVPVYELNRIKNGEDYVTPEGKIVSNSLLTRPSDPPRSYAYCSDTIYMPEIAEQIKGVDLLFHEATFANADLPRAKETFHTTAAQAGEIAKAAGVKKMVIGHFSARYEDENILLKEASAVFPETVLAKETLCLEV